MSDIEPTPLVRRRLTKQDVRAAMQQAVPGRPFSDSFGYVEREEGAYVTGIMYVDHARYEVRFKRGEERCVRQAVIEKIKATAQRVVERQAVVKA